MANAATKKIRQPTEDQKHPANAPMGTTESPAETFYEYAAARQMRNPHMNAEEILNEDPCHSFGKDGEHVARF